MFVPDFPESLSPESKLEAERYFYKVISKFEHYDLCVRYSIEYICKVLFKDQKDFRIIMDSYKGDFSAIRLYFDFKPDQTRIYFLEGNEREYEKFTDTKAFKVIEHFMQDHNVNMILLPLSVFEEGPNKPTSGHQNLMVIDKKHKTIEFYDPNGAEAHHNMYGYNVYNTLINEFIDYSPTLRSYQLMEYAQTCPSKGIQDYESEYPSSPGGLGGYCVLWTLFLLHLRIKNRDIHPEIVQSHYIAELSKRKPKIATSTLQHWWNKLVEMVRPKIPYEQFRTFIKRYAYYMFKQTEKHTRAEFENLTQTTRTRYQTKLAKPRMEELRSRVELFEHF
jgi:hypothetical protein